MRSVLILAFLIIRAHASAQCCSAGSGSPLGGGTSQGVLDDRQAEINLSLQHASSKKFLDGDSKDRKYLDYFGYDFASLRLSYGLTEKLTLAVEGGYFLDKKEIGVDGGQTIKSSGASDLIIFPRYTIYKHSKENTRDEVTIGLGYKIPLGKYNDSFKQVESFSRQEYYLTMPPGVQPTNGSHDFLFYVFGFRGYPYKNFRIFANGLYIKKGWNPQGLKFGDYASVSLFAGKTFFRKLGVTLQIKGEWIDKTRYNENLYHLGYYSFDVGATGMKMISVAPQLSYALGGLTVYAVSEFPLYQYVNKKQVASQHLYTAGLSYRFFTFKENGKD